MAAAPTVLEMVAERAERWGFTVDMNRHPCVFMAYHQRFTAAREHAICSGDASAFTIVQVDMLKVQERRRSCNQRSDNGALPTIFDHRTTPYDVYIFQGMSQASLVIYRTRSRRAGVSMMACALEDAAARITHPLHVPEMIFFAARQLGQSLAGAFPNMSRHIPDEDLIYAPYTAPRGSDAARGRWLCDVVVPHRYRYFVPTTYESCRAEVQVKELAKLVDYIQRHTDSVDSMNDIMPAAHPMIVAAAMPRRDSTAEELERRMQDRRSNARLIGDLMTLGFGDHSFLLHLEASTLARTRREPEVAPTPPASGSMLTPAALEELDRLYNLEQKRGRADDAEFCSRYSLVGPDDDDAYSQQFYNDISRYVSEHSFMDAMVEGGGAISYVLRNRERGTIPHTVISSLQMAAAVYAVLAHASGQYIAACDQCTGGPERLYVTVKTALDRGHCHPTAILWCWRNREQCPLCAVSVILVSLVYQSVNYAKAHGKPPPYSYLCRCNHMTLAGPSGIDVARHFSEALEFFCRVEDAIEFQRHPWRFSNFSYFPVDRVDQSGMVDLEASSWEDADTVADAGTAVYFDHTPVLAADGSLYTTRRVVDILYETSPVGHLERETRTMTLAASVNGARVPFGSQEIRMTPRQCDMIQACFNYPMGAYRTHMTNESNRELYLATGYRDRDDRPIPMPYARDEGRRYAMADDLLECKEPDFDRLAGVLHQLRRDHVHAWPLVIRNFLYGGDPELFWSILWIKKHVARHKAHTILTEADSRPAPSRMLTPGDPLFRELYTMLPALLEKAIGADQIFDELMEPFRSAISDPVNCGLDSAGRAAYTVNLAERHRERGTNNIYSALMTFVNAKEPYLAVDREVFLELAQLFRANDNLAEEKPRAALLLTYLFSADADAQWCTRANSLGDAVVLVNIASESNSERRDAQSLDSICGDWPMHFILYDAVLSEHVSAAVAKRVFLGIARHRRRRMSFVLPAFIHMKRYDVQCTSIDSSFALSREAYTHLLDPTPKAVPTRAYSILKELCANMEVLARFRHTASEEEAATGRLVHHLESDGGQVFRGLLAESFIRQMASVGSEPAVFQLVSDTSSTLLSCRLDLDCWSRPNDPLGAKTTRDMFPAWKPFLGPVYLDRTLLTLGNVVYGAGELSPFTGSATHLLECVAWHPITRVQVEDADDTAEHYWDAEWRAFVARVARPVTNQSLAAVRNFRKSCDSINAEEEEEGEETSASPIYKRPQSSSEEGSAPVRKALKKRLDDLRARSGVTDEMVRRLSTHADPILAQVLFTKTFGKTSE